MVTRVVRVAAAFVCAAVLAACGSPASTPVDATGAESTSAASGADSVDGEPADSDADDEGAAPEEVVVAQGSPVVVEPSEVSVTKAIAAAVGGKVSLRTADRERISLQIPPDALPVDSIITVTQATANGMPAILLEPAGLYLQRPARLTVPKSWASPTYQAFVRAGFAPDGELFVPAAEQGELVLISRLRPLVFTDGSVVEASVAEQDPVDVVALAAEKDAAVGSGSDEQMGEDPASSADDEQNGEDPAASADDEQSEEESSEESESDGRAAEAAQVAVAAIPVMVERCREPGAGKQLLEARRTAGAAAPQDLPECITRAVHVFAHMEMVWRPQGYTFVLDERISGRGEVSTEQESASFPLEGELVGQAPLVSLLGTSLASALATLVGMSAPPPSTEMCQQTALQNGVMTASIKEVPDEKLRVTLQPLGTYTLTCVGKSTPMDMVAFMVLREVKGVGEGQPFTVTLDRNGSSSNVFNLLEVAEQQGVRRKANGDVLIKEDGLTISVGMTVTIAEKLKDLQPKDDETDIQP